jgi:hypothetical protein
MSESILENSTSEDLIATMMVMPLALTYIKKNSADREKYGKLN